MRKTEFYMMMTLYSVVIGLAMHSAAVVVAGVSFVVTMAVLDVLTAVIVKWINGDWR